MKRHFLLAAAAAVTLAACNMLPGQTSGPPMPPVQAGAQAPTVLTPQAGVAQATNITAEQRQQLIANIGQQLDTFTGNFGGGKAPPAGFTDQINPLQPGTDHRLVMDLTANTPYTFVGACDGDCTNVDIELISMTTGGVVASDTLPDDYPVVNFTPPANGQYMVRTMLQNCTVAPCYVGMRALAEAPGAPGGAK
jgi:hypothetical protein